MSVFRGNQDKFVRHVGVYNSKRCVVILQLPEDPNNVHIVDTDALPDQYHQGLMDAVQSPEGQNARWLGDVLSRKMFADGTNALRTLYEKQYVAVVPVELVTLTPLPNKQVPLVEVLAQFQDPVQAQQSEQERELARIAEQEQRKLDESLKDDPNALRHNQHMENLSGDKTEQNSMIARNLLAEADLLEAEAKRKRNQAAELQEAAKKKTQVVEKTVDDDGIEMNSDGLYVDPETGKTYKSKSTLKGVMTKRAKKSA